MDFNFRRPFKFSREEMQAEPTEGSGFLKVGEVNKKQGAGQGLFVKKMLEAPTGKP